MPANSTGVNITQFVMSNGMTVEQTFNSEVSRFMRILNKSIDRFYGSYSPKIYPRTYGLYQFSCSKSTITSKGATSITLKANITWSSAVYKPALSKNYGYVNTLLLMEFGYSTWDPKMHDIPHFGYRSPNWIIRNAIEEFEADNTYGLKIENVWGPL